VTLFLILTNLVSAVVALALLLRCVWLKDHADALNRHCFRLQRDNDDLRERASIRRAESPTRHTPRIHRA
jgi:hypothetical protein